MQMKERTFAAQEYTYGFNGMEKDDEMNGEGNSYMTQYRQYNSRLGKWLSLDPKMAKYPNQSPYAAFNDNPIFFTDPFGDDPPERLSRWKRLGNWSRGEMYKNKANKYASQNDIDEIFIRSKDNEVEISESILEHKQGANGDVQTTEYEKRTTFRKGGTTKTENYLWATTAILWAPKPTDAYVPSAVVVRVVGAVTAIVAGGYYAYNLSDVNIGMSTVPMSKTFDKSLYQDWSLDAELTDVIYRNNRDKERVRVYVLETKMNGNYYDRIRGESDGKFEINLKKGSVYKYGIEKVGTTRYSENELGGDYGGLPLTKRYLTKQPVLRLEGELIEKAYIIGYGLRTRRLPPGNMIIK
jgi:RHS repeat-associated protein